MKIPEPMEHQVLIYSEFFNRLEKGFTKMKNYLTFLVMVLLELYGT